NGIYLTSADSTGVVTIPESKLAPGDTISSTFLGFEPAFVVYDNTLRATGSVTLVHSTERTYDIDEVVVRGSMDPWDAFRKYVRPLRRVIGNFRLTGNFEARIRMPDSTVRQIAGSFSQSRKVPVIGQEENVLGEITVTQGDTTQVGQKIRQYVFYSVLGANGVRIRTTASSKTRPYHTMTYLGIAEGIRNFVGTVARPDFGGGTTQWIIDVDAESREIRSVHITSTVTSTHRFESIIHSMAMKYPHDQNRSRKTASEIEVDFREVDGVKMTMKLTNLKYR
ncbi:MAG: hypothetical protein LBM20_08250, partial [Rikenellaceae bacterium]|nr:hypothetical protein [Rikenellaceae bacterium]